ncbi:hypothetical protein GobsT_59910 [Gemmata obscuriglobus]|uniref:Uncharacterized protein n=1 Tax=Gemmata obscuriglobus TaxID=114 RepID=A0A2Z3GSB0_9BACT|nr:hypothetical protein [Gemmata obscuriglobus]AWM36228.1 hypothetical protein C1280_03850 [Gemmata obscuriglobus]QEG31170.1 hypothetical protein GobsT_59910 [Gemmata obscuriglobus]VTS10508.1 unnamed protein product [Gemmata obscuriglobus UQM 2246]
MFSQRRVWIVGCVVALTTLAFAVSYDRWARQRAVSDRSSVGPTFTLDELCRDSLAEGWRVKYTPDMPGPYRRRLPGFLYYHPGPNGACVVRVRDTSGAVVLEEQTRPGIDFLTLVLETPDGQRTEGLLVRGE